MDPSASVGGKPDYDSALKWLFAQAPQAVVTLIWPGLTWQQPLSPDLPVNTRRADLVWEITDATGARGVLHIELQTKADPTIGERVTEYGVRLWIRERAPVRSVVLFLRPARTLPASSFVVSFMGRETLRYNFEIVKLWELPQARVLGSPEYALWPLATLMAGVTTAMTLEVAERLAQVEAPAQERSDLIGALAALAGLRLPRAQVLAALRRHPMIDELLRESSVVQGWLKEGAQLGEQRMARVALEGRFGPLNEDVLAAIERTKTATLEALVAHLASETLEQVRARLGL